MAIKAAAVPGRSNAIMRDLEYTGSLLMTATPSKYVVIAWSWRCTIFCRCGDRCGNLGTARMIIGSKMKRMSVSCPSAVSVSMRAMNGDISSGLTDADMISTKLTGYRSIGREGCNGMILIQREGRPDEMYWPRIHAGESRMRPDLLQRRKISCKNQ